MYNQFFAVIMRKFILLATITLAMTSCFETMEPQYSPEIYSSSFFVNPVFEKDSLVHADDTLRWVYNAESDTYELDTIYVGDTLVVATTYYTVNSNLVAVKMDWDSLRLNLWYTLTGEIEKVLTDESSIADGRLYFYPGYNRIAFPIYFSALEKGGTNLKLTVESDSEFSTTSVQFYLPIKYKVVKDSTILPNP